MGPPETNTVGIFSRMAAISIPGVILSQLEMHTIASAQWALTMYSTESAISSREGSEYSRSEEHTSELQSLMRISYAVFCLTKKHDRASQSPTIITLDVN